MPAHTLYDIVRKLPDGSEIELSLDGGSGQIRLRASRSNFFLSTLPREDFPGGRALPNFRAAHGSGGEMKNLIDRTRFAISTEETRYYLNGIYLHAGTSNSLEGTAGGCYRRSPVGAGRDGSA